MCQIQKQGLSVAYKYIICLSIFLLPFRKTKLINFFFFLYFLETVSDISVTSPLFLEQFLEPRFETTKKHDPVVFA